MQIVTLPRLIEVATSQGKPVAIPIRQRPRNDRPRRAIEGETHLASRGIGGVGVNIMRAAETTVLGDRLQAQ